MEDDGLTIYTVGHGNRTTEELAAILRGAGVRLLVDVRRFPASRRNPHLAREALAADLPQLGIDYVWHGEELGGRRRQAKQSRHTSWKVPGFRAYADYMDTNEFRAALAKVEEMARSGPALALMCAETLWWRCHRRLISDALALNGVEVVHLLGGGKQRQAHVLHPALRADELGRPVYDRGTTPDLFD